MQPIVLARHESKISDCVARRWRRTANETSCRRGYMSNSYSSYIGTSTLSGGVKVMAAVAYSAVDISAGSCAVMRVGPGRHRHARRST